MTQRPKLIGTLDLHKNRPISPHLSIYKMQLTSVLSILHRITGAYLYLGLAIFTWIVFLAVYSPYIITEISDFIYGNIFIKGLFKIMILSWTFSLFYHQLNGIRHLFWDIGKGFELETTYLSGKIVVALSILLTIICWFIVCSYTSPIDIIEAR